MRAEASRRVRRAGKAARPGPARRGRLIGMRARGERTSLGGFCRSGGAAAKRFPGRLGQQQRRGASLGRLHSGLYAPEAGGGVCQTAPGGQPDGRRVSTPGPLRPPGRRPVKGAAGATRPMHRSTRAAGARAASSNMLRAKGFRAGGRRDGRQGGASPAHGPGAAARLPSASPRQGSRTAATSD